MVWRLVGSVVGLVLFLVSIPLAISPIPVGLVLMFFAIVILVASNPLAASVLRFLRRHSRFVDRLFVRAEKILPANLAKPLHETEEGDHHHADTTDEDGGDGPEVESRQRFAEGPRDGEELPMMRRISIPRRLR